MPSKVHLAACADYDRDLVRASVRECCALLLPPDFMTPGMTVVLKPNIINDMPPERAVCTHPEVVRAVAEVALEAGAEVIIADQPGYALTENPEQAFERTGMLAVCEGLPVRFELLARGGYEDVAPPQPYRLATVQYATRALKADRVINLAKAKTHSQTLYTGAIKNMFGAMAPKQRIETHLLGRYWALCESIVDCYAARPPDFHIMDAVDIMEGMGPTQGEARRLGMIAASPDGVALDSITQQALGFGEEEIATTVAAANVELGVRHRAQIELSGADLETLAQDIRRSPVMRLERLGPFTRLFRGWVTARPSVDRTKCQSCSACAGICPGKAIAVEDYARIDCDRCVECFCCLEACPYDAIGVKRSPIYAVGARLQRLLNRKA